MTNPTHASVKQIENAYLRPSKNNWGVIALLCVIGSVPLLLSCTKILPVNITGQVLLGLYAAVILVPCALFGYWQKRAVVVADDTGLTWRGLGKWHTANWSEITDYYEQLRPKANTTITIVTESAKLNIKSDIWGKAAEFKKAIANKALNAQVRKWGFLGARSEVDWPRTFHYNTTDNRFAIYAMPGLIAVCFGLYAWNIAGGGYRTQTSLGLNWAVATIGISLFGILPLVLMSGLILRVSNTTKRRRHQHITLKSNGLVFESVNCRVEARWEEITDLVIEK